MLDDLGRINDLLPRPAVKEERVDIEIDLGELLAASQASWGELVPYDGGREVSALGEASLGRDVAVAGGADSDAGSDVLHDDLVSVNESLRDLVELERSEENAPVIAGAEAEGGSSADSSVSASSRNEIDTSSRVRGGPSSSSVGFRGGFDFEKVVDAVGDRFYNPTLLLGDAFSLLGKGVNALFGGGGGDRDKSSTKVRSRASAEASSDVSSDASSDASSSGGGSGGSYERTLISEAVRSGALGQVSGSAGELPAPEAGAVFEDVVFEDVSFAGGANPFLDILAGGFEGFFPAVGGGDLLSSPFGAGVLEGVVFDGVVFDGVTFENAAFEWQVNPFAGGFGDTGVAGGGVLPEAALLPSPEAALLPSPEAALLPSPEAALLPSPEAVFEPSYEVLPEAAQQAEAGVVFEPSYEVIPEAVFEPSYEALPEAAQQVDVSEAGVVFEGALFEGAIFEGVDGLLLGAFEEAFSVVAGVLSSVSLAVSGLAAGSSEAAALSASDEGAVLAGGASLLPAPVPEGDNGSLGNSLALPFMGSEDKDEEGEGSTVAGPDMQKEFLETSIVANESVDETFNQPERSVFVEHITESLGTAAGAAAGGGGAGNLLMMGLVAIIAVALAPVLEKVVDVIGKLVDFFTEKVWPVLEPLVKAMADVFVRFLNGLSPYAETLGRVLGSVFVNVLGIVDVVMQTLKEIFVENKEAIKSIVKGLVDIVDTIVGGVLEGIKLLFDDPGEFFSGVISAIGEAVVTAFEQLGKIGEAAVGAVTGIAGAVTTGAVGVVADTASALKTGFQDLTGVGYSEEEKEALRQQNIARIELQTEQYKIQAFQSWAKAAGGFLKALNIDEMEVTARTVNIYPGALSGGVDMPEAETKVTAAIEGAGGSDFSSHVNIINNNSVPSSPVPSDMARIAG